MNFFYAWLKQRKWEKDQSIEIADLKEKNERLVKRVRDLEYTEEALQQLGKKYQAEVEGHRYIEGKLREYDASSEKFRALETLIAALKS